MHKFVSTWFVDDSMCLLASTAQIPGAQAQTADLVRDYAIESGYHPIMIALESGRQHQQSASGNSVPQAAPRLESYKDFDVIPFALPSDLGQEAGFATALKKELAALINLCKDNYNFVILEAQMLMAPQALEDLIALSDMTLLVLDAENLDEAELADWQKWAQDEGKDQANPAHVGLVLQS